MKKKCKLCNKTHDRKKSDYCSTKCRDHANYKPAPKPSGNCIQCGKLHSRRSNYCSILCYNIDRGAIAIRTEKTCIQCGEKHSRFSEYCSDRCYGLANYPYEHRTSQTCLQCGEPSRKLSNYCSRKCCVRHKKIARINTCLCCNKQFEKGEGNCKNSKSNFCSSKCRHKYKYNQRVESGLCTYCGENPSEENILFCGVCRAEVNSIRRNKLRKSQELQIYKGLISRSKKKGLPVNITPEDIIIPEFCPVLGIKLERGNGQPQPNSPSIDRIKPELGYVKGNICVISQRANLLKSNATIEEIEAVLRYMKHHKH